MDCALWLLVYRVILERGLETSEIPLPLALNVLLKWKVHQSPHTKTVCAVYADCMLHPHCHHIRPRSLGLSPSCGHGHIRNEPLGKTPDEVLHLNPINRINIGIVHFCTFQFAIQCRSNAVLKI